MAYPRFKYFRELHRSVEFERCMKLLKANNGAGAMTEAIWLLYEEAYYSGRYTGLGKWKQYLNNLEDNKQTDDKLNPR